MHICISKSSIRFLRFCLGQEIEGQSRLVRRHSLPLQAAQREIEGSFGFTARQNRLSPAGYQAWIERQGSHYQLLFGEFELLILSTVVYLVRELNICALICGNCTSFMLVDCIDCIADCRVSLMSWFQCLDEVQSYILVERSRKDNNVALDSEAHEYVHAVSISLAMCNWIKRWNVQLLLLVKCACELWHFFSFLSDTCRC